MSPENSGGSISGRSAPDNGEFLASYLKPLREFSVLCVDRMKRFGVLGKIGRGSGSVLLWNINKCRYRPTHVSVTGDNIFKNRITGAIIAAVVLLIAKLPDALCVIIIFYENFKIPAYPR